MTDTFNEKSDTQKFWLTLIRDVFSIINPEAYIVFEKRVLIEHIGFIDAYIPSTGVIIEQKSPGKDLDAAFVQAKNYHDWLPVSQRGRYIITCDFNELHVHDLEEPKAPPQVIPVSEASRDNLAFLLTPGETLPIEVTLSVKAGLLVKTLYDSLRASLPDEIANSDHSDKLYRDAIDNINIFCVRVVFLLYAEDSGLFAKHQFHDYLEPRAITAADSLQKLFTVLNTEPQRRSPYLADELKAFPFVNGGLFEKAVDFPQLDPETVNIIIRDMSSGFNWAGISPTIFGAIFESTLNEETRKQEGIHYTSPENIHKIIDPLFLEELSSELTAALSEPHDTHGLLAFQDKLASLRFLDPACGSGNFLTESFIHLRRIENRILAALPDDSPRSVKVSITQFHGIESHDFAVNVAKTALWISDHQMWKETVQITGRHDSPLPLKDYDGIIEADAISSELFSGWNVPHDDMLYIMGNPPFLGYSQQNKKQKDQVKAFFGQSKSDYVACWFKIAAECVHRDKNTKAAFVATNSVVQGEQVAYVFKDIREKWGLKVKIEFAYHPFMWENELPEKKDMAKVHVVIVCFSSCPPPKRRLFTKDGVRLVDNINFYLADGPDEDIAVPTKTPVTEGVPPMITGNRPADGGHLLITAEDYEDFITREPGAAKYVKRYVMGDDFLNKKARYCLWLVDATPHEIQSMPMIKRRVEACRADRLRGAPDRQKLANTAWLFREQINPKHYIAIPETSSERREYIPMGWLDESMIPGNSLHIIPDATLYDFGVLTSRVHMAWVRRVCGRMRTDYRYSNTICYNTFVWPSVVRGDSLRNPTPALPLAREGESKSPLFKGGFRGVSHYTRICETAQEILEARAKYPDSSLAELYNEGFMPVELRRAHEMNDEAVCRAYGWREDIEEEEIVRRLFVLYHEVSGN